MSGWKRRAAGAALAAGVALLGCGKKAGAPESGSSSFRLAGATVVVKALPAKLLGSKAFRAFAKEMKKLPGLPPEVREKSVAAAFEEKLGVDPMTLKSLTLSFNPDPDEERMVMAAVSSVTIRVKKVLDTLKESAGKELKKIGSYAGVDIYGTGDKKDPAVAFPTSRLIVAGTPAQLKKCLAAYKAGKKGRYPAGLARAMSGAPAGSVLVVAVAFTPDMARQVKLPIPVPDMGETLSKLDTVLVAVEAGDAFDVTVRLRMKAEADAAEMRKQATDGLARAKGWLIQEPPGTVSQSMPGQQNAASWHPGGLVASAVLLLESALGAKGPNPILDSPQMKLLKDLIASVSIGGSGKAVEVKVSIRPEIVPAVMPIIMMLMDGMGGRKRGAAPGMRGGGAGR